MLWFLLPVPFFFCQFWLSFFTSLKTCLCLFLLSVCFICMCVCVSLSLTLSLHFRSFQLRCLLLPVCSPFASFYLDRPFFFIFLIYVHLSSFLLPLLLFTSFLISSLLHPSPFTFKLFPCTLSPFILFFSFHHFSFVNALRSSSYSPSLNLFCFLPPSFLPSAHARLFSSLTLVTLTTTPPACHLDPS